MTKKTKISALVLTLLLVLSITSFAGSWNTIPINDTLGYGAVDGVWKEYGPFESSGQPAIDLWVNPSSGSKTVTVFLLEWNFDYSTYQWVPSIIDQKSYSVGDNKYMHDVWSQMTTLRGWYSYVVQVEGNPTPIDGEVQYYQ